MAFDRQPFASTHPAINALFAAEFAQSQAQRQAEAQAMANETARAQIGAQTQLAQSQMRQAQVQQDYNNLFREREFQSRSDAEQARQKLYEDQLKIDKAYKEGILKSGGLTVEDKRKADIAATNAAAKAAALRFQDLYETNLATELEAARKSKAAEWFTTSSGAAKAMENEEDPARIAAVAKAWANTVKVITADRTGAGQLVIPDMKSRTFSPVLLDDSGNMLGLPAASSNPAALGKSSATTPSGGLTQGEKIGAVTTIGGELVKKGLNSLADMFKIGGTNAVPSTVTTNAAPAGAVVAEPTTTGTNAPSVKTFYGSRIFLLTPEDDAILRNAMDGAPSEAAKTNVFQRFMRYLIESGRAVDTNERVGGIRVEIPASDGAAIPGLSNPSYLDSALGPRFGEPERYGAPFNP